MALVFTILVIVAVLCLGHFLFEEDEEDRNNTWKGW